MWSRQISIEAPSQVFNPGGGAQKCGRFGSVDQVNVSENIMTQRKKGAAAKVDLLGTRSRRLLTRPRAHVFCANICVPNSHLREQPPGLKIWDGAGRWPHAVKEASINQIMDRSMSCHQ